ncbi:MAG: transcription elongation factor GreA [Lachnospiraceae bacterium]|nr:transcription elongation factor GreA [Lachnospiraceae bacterium]
MAEEVVNGKKVILTADGLKKLEDELSDLKNVRRAEIAQELKEARAQGDLSENAEYDAAKDAQRIIEERIVEIESLLKNVEVVDSSEIDSERVSIGCRVKLRDMEYKEDMEFLMVGSTEASSLQGKMSNESPVGKAILGHKKGETVKVETKAGKIKYKILDVYVDKKKK